MSSDSLESLWLVVSFNHVLCGNKSVVKSTASVVTRSNRKHEAIDWHAVREVCTAGGGRLERSHLLEVLQTFSQGSGMSNGDVI